MAAEPAPVVVVGRYAIHRPLAAGGMATVHLGRLLGEVGFARTVAIKRLHAQFSADPDFVAMLVDEARIAARIHHPNVVQTLDIVNAPGELLLVMEYVHGQALSRLLRDAPKGELVPVPIVSSVITAMLHGLHAAHEAKGDDGQPLGVIHRDVSPQNLVVGVDGVARVLDFGVAKAANRVQATRSGQLKGKLAYMAPEQLRAKPTSRLVDVYASGVVLWEALTRKRLFSAEDEGSLIGLVLEGDVHPPSTYASHVSPELDAIVLRMLARDPAARFPTARDAARAIEMAARPALASEVGEWVTTVAAKALAERAALVAELESLTGLESQGRLIKATPQHGGRDAPQTPLHARPDTSELPTLEREREQTLPLSQSAPQQEMPSGHSAATPVSHPLMQPAPPPSRAWLGTILAAVVCACVGAALITGVVIVRARKTPARIEAQAAEIPPSAPAPVLEPTAEPTSSAESVPPAPVASVVTVAAPKAAPRAIAAPAKPAVSVTPPPPASASESDLYRRRKN